MLYNRTFRFGVLHMAFTIEKRIFNRSLMVCSHGRLRFSLQSFSVDNSIDDNQCLTKTNTHDIRGVYMPNRKWYLFAIAICQHERTLMAQSH